MLRSRRAIIAFIAAIVLLAVGLAVGAGVWVAWRVQHHPYRAMSEAMSPTIHAGDILIPDFGAYRDQTIARGDIITYIAPDSPSGRPFVGRIVAIDGDTVRIANGKLYVNDAPVEEPYLAEPIYYTAEELTVPPGHVYVLGDNRNDSNDSHLFGPVRVDAIQAKVVEIRPAP